MNVDEAIAYASKDKCFWAGEVHAALETLAKEVERLRAEVKFLKENRDAFMLLAGRMISDDSKLGGSND